MSSVSFKDYIDAVSESSKRTRVVSIILFVAITLSASAWWNSRNHSWANARVQRAFAVLYELKDSTPGIDTFKLWSNSPHDSILDARVHRVFAILHKPKDTTGAPDRSRLRNAKHLLYMFGLDADDSNRIKVTSEEDIKRILPELEEAYEKLRDGRNSEYFILRTGPLNITLDLYDLPVISGWVLSGVLLFLALSLAGELEALTRLKNKVGKELQKEVYDIVSVKLMLAIPLSIGNHSDVDRQEQTNAVTGSEDCSDELSRRNIKHHVRGLFLPFFILLVAIAVQVAIVIRFDEISAMLKFVDNWRAGAWWYAAISLVLVVAGAVWCGFLTCQIHRALMRWREEADGL